MAAQEPALTPKETRELLITVRQNQATMSTLSEQIKDIHRVVIGNGKFKESIVGRLQIVEERQMVGADKQDEIYEAQDKMQKCLDRNHALLERDHARISRLEASQAKGDKERAELKDVVEAARNKAIGIGIGVGLGTGAGLFGISQLIAKLTEGITP
jgi:ElaB/YqjD/DUF883 family membrane-anchored ribosome-binding protein